MKNGVELLPLKPFCGSYKCALSEADTIDEILVEKDGGLIVKEKVPRKKFVGLIAVERAATPEEQLMARERKLPDHLEIDERGLVITEHPKQRTVIVPADVANSLVHRGLAKRVSPDPKAEKTAA